jgi:hypothetical protein
MRKMMKRMSGKKKGEGQNNIIVVRKIEDKNNNVTRY